VEQEELKRPFLERALQPLLDALYARVLRLTPSGVQERLRARLAQAGRPMEAGRYVGIKVLAPVSVGLLSTLALGGLGVGGGSSWLLPAVVAGIAYVAPDWWLGRTIASRRKAVRRALPDLLDLLCVSVEAGLGFDGAIQKVADKFADPVGGEFREYLKEVRLGTPRADALRHLSERTGVPEMKSFTAAIIQADQLGVSVSRVLRVQSEQMRTRRKQTAEERAMKTPVKMLLPLVFFIFPTIFIVLLAPALLRYLMIFGK